MSDHVKMYTSADMTVENLKKQHLVLVDFWAPWCGPCKMLAPIFEALAGEIKDVVFAKLNIDENTEMAIGLGIRSIPTMMLIKDGAVVETLIGLQNRQTIIDMIDRHR